MPAVMRFRITIISILILPLSVSLSSAEEFIVKHEIDLIRGKVVEWVATATDVRDLDESEALHDIDLPNMWKKASASLRARDEKVVFLRAESFMEELDGEAPNFPKFSDLIFEKIEIRNLFTMAGILDYPTVVPNKFVVIFSFKGKDGNFLTEIAFLHDGTAIKANERDLTDLEKTTIADRIESSEEHLKELDRLLKQETGQ